MYLYVECTLPGTSKATINLSQSSKGVLWFELQLLQVNYIIYLYVECTLPGTTKATINSSQLYRSVLRFKLQFLQINYSTSMCNVLNKYSRALVF